MDANALKNQWPDTGFWKRDTKTQNQKKP